MTFSKSCTGRFLVASPSLSDPNFKRSVVLVCDHHPKGAFGVVVNRPMSLPLSSVFPSIFEDCEDASGLGEAHYGGPVDPNRMLAIRHVPSFDLDDAENSVRVGDGLELVGDVDRALNGIANETIAPSIYRFFLGYAGWGEGQLESELDEGSWIVCPADGDTLFGTSGDELWPASLRRLGGIYALLSEFPADPEVN